ncbi:hypothetical protein INS49_013430 [Diaporthe citri]|uniref:uncharacterized protein n=1 Tax=Diaporthe citri TaxID=83186 RepID=UPI001C7E2A30|nr:uncharacterized protein INS49_013430 [Diaporthe citri]KAG6357553.1 hypothetical protein INS49_013430 [Diaporthe citri]
MAYDIPFHRLEGLERDTPDDVADLLKASPRSTKTETARVYNYVGISEGRLDDPDLYELKGFIRPDFDPTTPPKKQSLQFPELFRDVMRIRQDVLVREFGGKLEDIASDLWGDSVSLHWVVYITDHVADESLILGEGKNSSNRKIRIPVGTIKVQPVIGMRQKENKAAMPPFVGERTRSNYLQLSEAMVLAPYREDDWVQRILYTAVLNTFNEHLPPSFFHDIFGRVIPLDDKPLKDTRLPGEVAGTRRQWKDQFVELIPDALQWSGLMCVQAEI